MINEAEAFQPIFEIIDFNYPTKKEKEDIYQGKTIFFERVFFKTLSHVCQECLVNSEKASFIAQLPRHIYITKYVPKLQVKEVHWEKITEQTSFINVENRNVWAKLVLEFANRQFMLSDTVSLPENIRFSAIQTNLLILFCYFYYFNREYATLSSTRMRDKFILPGTRDITWALFEPGVISQFIAPLRKLAIFSRFDERDLAQFFKLSGNSLSSLRWILRPIYEEWFQPLQSYIALLNKDKILTEERFSIKVLHESSGANITPNKTVSSQQTVSFLSFPQVSTENSRGETGNIFAKQEQKNWEQMYYEKLLEGQELRQQLVEKTSGVSSNEVLAVFEELLRYPGEFEELFSEILPKRGQNTNMRKWRTLERTMLSLRSLFLKLGFVAFGRVNDIVSMKTVAWPYVIDTRFSITNPEVICERWRITRRGVKRKEIIILPIFVQPV